MRWALILYDEDGFTSIEKTTFLTGNIKQTSVCKLKITNGKTYKVEILQLADTKAELNKYAKNWGLTHRALAIHNAIKKHKGSKKGGFLSVWPSDDENNFASDRSITPPGLSTDLITVGTTSPNASFSPTASEGTSTNRDTIPANGSPCSEKIQGKNNRAITVLFEGAGDYADTQADPCRSPNNTDMLTRDQADLLSLQITQSEAKSRSYGSQTLPVVVTKTVQEIQDLCVKPTCVDAATQCDNVCPCPNAENSEKIDKLLEMVQALDYKFESKFNTSLVSVDLLESMLNISNRNDTSISRVAAEEQHLENEINTCLSPKTTLIQEPGTTLSEIGETVETVEMSCEKENQVYTPNEQITMTLQQDADQTPQFNYVLDASSSLKMIKEKHFSHPCYLGGIAEICSENDIPTDRNELRIHADLVRQARLNACSIGNFGWILVKKVFSSDELVGKNYNGKRGKAGLSPRRLHAIEHACLDSYGPGPNVNKLAKAVNTGLRNYDFAPSKRPVFRPLV